MRQVLQDIRSGEIAVHNVPEPLPEQGYALVEVSHSLISSGTERASADLGKASLLRKARARPDLVRKTIAVARTEGLGNAARRVNVRLDRYTPFGYSCAGVILDTGGDERLQTGAVVACVGAGYASHAEVVSVPTTLTVPVPKTVSSLDAAFAAPAAIALHAIRLADVGPGSAVGVIGLGLIGQLTGRLLAASGCTSVGTDLRRERRELFGHAAAADEFASLAADASRGRGLDAVIVCAAARTSGPIEAAVSVARDRATIVVVGDIGLDLDRRPLYEKELSLVVARSYGPGRYDRSYEERGLDYPIGYVRWTEMRNVEAVLDLLSDERLQVRELVTHRLPIQEGATAYRLLEHDDTVIAIALEYSKPRAAEPTRAIAARARNALRVGVIGAGNFARGTLLPELARLADAEVVAVCTRTGASAKATADRFGINSALTDWRSLIADEAIDAIVLATPHAEHAAIAAAALDAGKSVYVEKPLALSWDELVDVATAARRASGVLLVGHNRRFARLAERARNEVVAPCTVVIRVAAGPLRENTWLDDPEQGGRVLGEISHFVDLAAFLGRGVPEQVHARLVPVGADAASLVACVDLSDGSAAVIAYASGESPGLPKERIEMFGARASVVLDDFRSLTVHGRRGGRVRSRRDKGHRSALAAFAAAAAGREALPVSLEEQLSIAAGSLALFDSAREGRSVTVLSPE